MNIIYERNSMTWIQRVLCMSRKHFFSSQLPSLTSHSCCHFTTLHISGESLILMRQCMEWMHVG